MCPGFLCCGFFPKIFEKAALFSTVPGYSSKVAENIKRRNVMKGKSGLLHSKNPLFKGALPELSVSSLKTGIFLTFVWTGALAKSGEAGSHPVPVRKAEPAVFYIKHAPYHRPHPSDGTGFVVEMSGRRYFVTNIRSGKSLIKDRKYRVQNKKGRTLKQGDIKGLSFMHGLVVAELKKYKGVALRVADFTKTDMSFFIMGFPGGDFTVRRAQTGREIGNGRVLGVRDVPLRIGGSKGGPVLNGKGEVIGVISPAHNYQALFIQSRIIRDLIPDGPAQGQGGDKEVKEDFLSVFESAEGGSAEAQYVMGHNLHTVYQSTRDLEFSHEAVGWYTKSAVQGHFLSRLELGLMYLSGEGVLRDLNESEKWLRPAVNQKKSPLADFYLSLVLIAKGSPEGAKLMEQSADGGLRPARDFMDRAGGLNGHDISMWLKPLLTGGCDRILFQL